MSEVIRKFRYQRGDDYSVDVISKNDIIVCYCNFKTPDILEEGVFDKFIEEAEHAVIKKSENLVELPNGNESK